MAMAHHLPAPEKEKLIKNSPVTWLVRKQDVRLNYEVETLQWPRSTWTPPKTQTRCRWVLTQQVKPIETSALTMCVFDSLILVSDLKVLKNSSLYFCPSVHGKTKSVFTSFFLHFVLKVKIQDFLQTIKRSVLQKVYFTACWSNAVFYIVFSTCTSETVSVFCITFICQG